MKINVLFPVFLFIFFNAISQNLSTNKSSQLYKSAPEWAKLMYSDHPNIYEVDKDYEAYYKSHNYKKSYHTQYYKRWRKAVGRFINTQGYFDPSIKDNLLKKINSASVTKKASRLSSGNWTVIGPLKSYREGGTVLSGAQANVYSIDYCEAVPNTLYCGTESGEVYKTINGGDNWVNVSYNLVTAFAPGAVIANAGISAIAVHPTNSDIVYVGSGIQVFKTTNGGASWNLIFDSNIPLGGYMENPAEIHINKSNPNIVLLAGKAGIHRSIDAGTSWNQVHSSTAFDIKSKPGVPTTLYSIIHNTGLDIHQFLISTDSGATWNIQANGWYNSTDPNRLVIGARIGVTEADSNRVYAFLIGDSKADDHGFIGVYRSDDAASTWYNTSNHDGAPYSDPGHQNLLASNPVTGGFHQGFYNCAIMVSNTNPDEVLVGGIGMWRSNDGGQTFNCIYGYGCGNYAPMHVDMQDFRALGNTYWATTDGGVFKSYDLFNTQPEFKMNGVHGTDFWGFGSGWNHDLLVGGTFHNGVDVYSENFPDGVFLDLGGGEPASGYVHPSEHRIYSSTIGSKIIPQSITGAVVNASMGMAPNESPWIAQSSEMEFHPSCYNYVYLGNENQLFKSEDGGANYEVVYTAPGSSKVLGIEISRNNPSIMYVSVRPETGNTFIAKTINDWETFTVLTLPISDIIPALISLNPENDQDIWLAYPHGPNGNKVYRSTSGGATWNNQTSSELDGHRIQSITTIGGTNGGLYLGTGATCFYKNDSMNAWVLDNLNLPQTIGATGLRPFYRDGKIRLASYGKGIWESPLYETPVRPVAKIMVDKLRANCLSEIFYFDDYSMLNHNNATWAWTFENGDIATSSTRNPEVTFNTAGTHQITLTVTNNAGVSDTDIIYIEVENFSFSNTEINNNFEVNFMQEGWFQQASSSFFWNYDNTVGGFGQSFNSMVVNNYVLSQNGESCEMVMPLNLNNLTAADAMLTFDVAYAVYGDAYVDALEILVSTDCGVTWQSEYLKSGLDLATYPTYLTDLFVPSNSDWRTETLDLSAYLGTNIYISFKNINGYGQALYVDNINIGNSSLNIEETESQTSFTLFPNPVSTTGNITIKSSTTETLTLSLYSLEGKHIANIFTKTNTEIPLKHYKLSTGMYLYNLRTKQNIKKGKLIVANRD